MMKRRILFLCTGNSARSQMAEALVRLMAGDHFEAVSAGTHPVGLNPGAIEAMRELEVDISRQQSKSVSDFVGQPFDYVITVCDRAKEACPIFPDALHLLHWSFDDPATAPDEQRREVFRKVRDEITDALWQFLVTEGTLPPGLITCYRCDPMS
jgi:arsenate reductase (thioredoxin)